MKKTLPRDGNNSLRCAPDGRSLWFGVVMLALLVSFSIATARSAAAQTTQTLTILGASGVQGDVDPYTEYSRDGGATWHQAFLTGWHPWSFVPGTNSWVNFDPSPFVGLNSTTLYRVRFFAPATWSNPKMFLQIKADNEADVSFNGTFIAHIVGQSSVNADLVFSQALQPGLNTIYISLLDYGGWVGFNYRIDLSVVSDSPLVQIDVDPSTDAPPNASAGPDVSANEGQAAGLDGSLSVDPDSDPLTYAWTQLGGTPVTLSDIDTSQPTFTAPAVATGGETLTFQLTVTANGVSDTDTVNITVVNVNHAPVADAGSNVPVLEGAPVTLHGDGSYDPDSDAITYAWTQVSGPPVSITGASTASPSFTAPILGSGGAPGVVASLVFRLTVDDSIASDADTVTVDITNVNNDPSADAGTDVTRNENGAVQLNGNASSDPDSDPLTYRWAQVGGPNVLLDGADTAMPSFTSPFVSPGGGDLTFQVTVDDGYGGTDTDTVVVHVQNINDPPLVSAAQPTIGCLWPPNHKLVLVGILGVSDPENNATISIDSVWQDEPVNGLGDGDTSPDAIINADGTVLLRAERWGKGDGRVYRIRFTASDLEGSASGEVTVCVALQKPHSTRKSMKPSTKKSAKSDKSVAIDGGALYDATERVEPKERVTKSTKGDARESTKSETKKSTKKDGKKSS